VGTTFEQIECQALTYIKNDLSLDWDLKNRLPVFYRRMWNYMQSAIPLFNKPPIMLSRLHAYTEPEYSDVLMQVSEVSVDGTVTIETEITEMDICSAGIVSNDEFGNPQYLPLTVDSYDAETGTVVISGTIAVGDEVDIDFYKSGSFDADLNATECDILAFCIYDVWEHRFDNNALERASKIRDANFTTISEASQTNAGTDRQTVVDRQLFDKLRMYELNAVYMNTVAKTPLF
jgi:hypothetical protein